jgi:hypothetical protein
MRIVPSVCFPLVVAALLPSCAAPRWTAPAGATPAPVVVAAPSPAPESRKTSSEMIARYDLDGDGRISRAEYRRTDAAFRNLDRDKDGVITKSDFDVPVAMPPDLAAPFLIVRRFAGPEADAIRIGDLDEAFENVDTDRDGAIDRAEFTGGANTPGPDRFLPLLTVADANTDGRLALDELKAYAVRRDRDGDGSISRRERMRPGAEPRVGWFDPAHRERAPDFTLPRDEGEGSVALSSFRKKKPVALIFGSYT